ncbi:uncharacterized protein TNCV_4631701 [Trichonephila clavipes]|nr:uncharacterized protein TNCV_4631701 [Trichonephila clavipes]
MKFGFSRTTISRVYREYLESGKISNLLHHCGRKKNMQGWNQRRLTTIIKRDRCVTLPQIAAISMLVHQQVSPCEPFNGTPSAPKAYSCILVDCTTQSFKLRMGPSTPTLDC